MVIRKRKRNPVSKKRTPIKAKKKPEMPRRLPGRPTKYEDRFCLIVKGYGDQGWSKKRMARALRVSNQTLLNWEHEHPEFFEALKESRDRSEVWWEITGVRGMLGKIKGFVPVAYIYQHKNRFGEGEGAGRGAGAGNRIPLTLDLDSLTNDELDKLETLLRKAKGLLATGILGETSEDSAGVTKH